MKHLGDIKNISGFESEPVDCVTGGSPCQDLSVAGKRAGLEGERSGLFMEQIRLIKELRDADRLRGRTGVAIRPRYMVWENVPGAFSSNGGKDFKAVLEETIRIAEPDAPDIPLPDKWPMADAYYGDGWSIAYRVFDAQFWGVLQRRRRIALVADFGGQSAPEILFVRESLSGDIEQGGASREETAGTVGGSTYPPIARSLTQRYDGSPCVDRGPNIVIQGAYKSGGQSLNLNNTCRQGNIVRRLTPLECERLQGYPDGWTDIGEWTDTKGKKHKEADSPRYKALGNSIALPNWKWILKRISAQYERDATLGSLFDGIGGFPLIWEQINGKGNARWASEIEEFPIAVTKNRFVEW